MITSNKKRLQDIFNSTEPLGPTHLERKEDFVPEILIRENMPYRRLIQNPAFLIGRKGSGKSSLLYSTCLDEDAIRLELPSDDLFTEVVRFINKSTDEYTTVEQAESVWSFAFLVAMAAKLVDYFCDSDDNDRDIDVLRKFLRGLDADANANPFVVILNGLKSLKASDADGLRFEQAARYWSYEGMTRSDVELAVVELLSRRSRVLRILIDSIEDYKLDEKGAFPALSGFIRFVGQFKSHSARVFIQCALPAEVYFAIIEQISSNPAKDFSRCELVHWSASELLYLAAKRLLVYIKLWNPNLYETRYKSMEDMVGRKFSRKFWSYILPRTIKNGLGVEENTEAYIIRHTQLSPRHVILYLNSIVRMASDHVLGGHLIEDSIIVESVGQTEKQLCQDIFAGWSNNYNLESVDYRYQGYAQAADLCEALIPYLPHKFRYIDFRKAYSRHVADSIKYIADVDDAVRLLVEIGIIGRVTNRVPATSRYIAAEFEYALPSRLRYTTNSEFCIHPAFIGTFGSEELEPKPPFAVYPIGSDPDEPDYRDLME